MDTNNPFLNIITSHPYTFGGLIAWTLIWKGLALWKSAQLQHKFWFISILIINSLGLLEMIYLFIVSRKYKVEVVEEK